jgi:hypothetical protein
MRDQPVFLTPEERLAMAARAERIMNTDVASDLESTLAEDLLRAVLSDAARDAESTRRIALLLATYNWIMGSEEEYPRRGLAAEIARAQEETS